MLDLELLRFGRENTYMEKAFKIMPIGTVLIPIT
jgi:hypothetical protein